MAVMNDSSQVSVPIGALGGDEEFDAQSLLSAASTQLPGDVPPGFANLLFARTAPEDILVYGAAELAVLARDAWAFLAERKPGTAKMRFMSPSDDAGGRLKSVSIIEVVNDDMPFLVDSVMSELTDRGLGVRLVAHPVFAI